MVPPPAEGGYLEVVQRLLDAKADVNAAAAEYEGRSALQAATEGGYLEVVALLNSLDVFTQPVSGSSSRIGRRNRERQ
ncbi:hypothetical protein B7463_g3823, partial [Scytalidium lignicola]